MLCYTFDYSSPNRSCCWIKQPSGAHPQAAVQFWFASVHQQHEKMKNHKCLLTKSWFNHEYYMQCTCNALAWHRKTRNVVSSLFTFTRHEGTRAGRHCREWEGKIFWTKLNKMQHTSMTFLSIRTHFKPPWCMCILSSTYLIECKRWNRWRAMFNAIDTTNFKCNSTTSILKSQFIVLQLI